MTHHQVKYEDGGDARNHIVKCTCGWAYSGTWKTVRERQRAALLQSRLLAVAGTWQSRDGVSHLIARQLVDLSSWLGGLADVTHSRDFH